MLVLYPVAFLVLLQACAGHEGASDGAPRMKAPADKPPSVNTIPEEDPPEPPASGRGLAVRDRLLSGPEHLRQGPREEPSRAEAASGRRLRGVSGRLRGNAGAEFRSRHGAVQSRVRPVAAR